MCLQEALSLHQQWKGRKKRCSAVSALLGSFLSFVLLWSSFHSFVYMLHSKLYSLGVCWIVSVYDTASEGSRCWFCLGSRFCFPPHTCRFSHSGKQVEPCAFFFFFQVDSITSMVRGAVVARAFEQTKCFTPGRGLQGKSPGL